MGNYTYHEAESTATTTRATKSTTTRQQHTPTMNPNKNIPRSESYTSRNVRNHTGEGERREQPTGATVNQRENQARAEGDLEIDMNTTESPPLLCRSRALPLARCQSLTFSFSNSAAWMKWGKTQGHSKRKTTPDGRRYRASPKQKPRPTRKTAR